MSTGTEFIAGNLDTVSRALHAAPCELYFLGASVSTQRNGWTDQLASKLGQLTGHVHAVRKTSIGGVGLLYGLAHMHETPSAGRQRIALVEFSTGDLNLGLTPLDRLEPWLRELLARLIESGALVVVVHNWRGDYAVDDKHGIRAAYNRVCREFGVSVIENHSWAQSLIDAGHVKTSDWFRDVCHTTEVGATAYAEQVIACIAAGRDTDVPPTEVRLPPSRRIRALPLVELPELPARWPQREFHYAPTDQRFQVLTLPQDDALRLRLKGELLGIAVISGPRSTWINVFADDRRLRKLRTFDRNSYYERYLLCACPAELNGEMLDIRCDPEPLDTSIAAQPHADFELPRQLPLIGLVGRDLTLC